MDIRTGPVGCLPQWASKPVLSKLHGFTFGTRLTNITRHLHQRDVDAALAAAGAEAQDWEGGTRIGGCLHAFNRDWSRRVMGQGAVVLLVTDGLDRGDPEVLAREMQRLQLSSRRLIWLNPLLRWDGFAPKAQGIRAMALAGCTTPTFSPSAPIRRISGARIFSLTRGPVSRWGGAL